MSPSAVLVIHNGEARLINVRNQDAITKVLDMVPGAVNKVTSLIKGKDETEDPEVEEAVRENMESEPVREDI